LKSKKKEKFDFISEKNSNIIEENIGGLVPIITIKNLTNQAIPLNILASDPLTGQLEESIVFIQGRGSIQVNSDQIRPEQLDVLVSKRILRKA